MTLLDEIIDAAGDEKVPIGTLLRKCLVLEQQVKNEKFKAWLDRELDGYGQNSLLKERVGDRNRLIEESAGIVAQVNNEALEVVAGLGREIDDCLFQTELTIGVGSSSLRACAIQQEVGLSCNQRHGNACRRAEENQGSSAHHPRTFCTSFAAHHGPAHMRIGLPRRPPHTASRYCS